MRGWKVGGSGVLLRVRVLVDMRKLGDDGMLGGMFGRVFNKRQMSFRGETRGFASGNDSAGRMVAVHDERWRPVEVFLPLGDPVQRLIAAADFDPFGFVVRMECVMLHDVVVQGLRRCSHGWHEGRGMRDGWSACRDGGESL